jgi:uncharacterized protein (DUF697 family)
LELCGLYWNIGMAHPRCATNPLTFIDLLLIQAIPLNCLYLFGKLLGVSYLQSSPHAQITPQTAKDLWQKAAYGVGEVLVK